MYVYVYDVFRRDLGPLVLFFALFSNFLETL